MTWQQAGSRTDGHGQTVPDWDTTTDTELDVYWETASIPGASGEVLDGRDALVIRGLILTNELGINGRDRIVRDGLVYEIDGPVRVVGTPRGVHHAELDVVRVEG